MIISYTLRAHTSDKMFNEALEKAGMKKEKIWSEEDSSIFRVVVQNE